MDGYGVAAMLVLAAAYAAVAVFAGLPYDRHTRSLQGDVALAAGLALVLALVLGARQEFLVTAAGAIPAVTLYFWLSRSVTWHQALYMSCIVFMGYDLAVLLGSNVLGAALGALGLQPAGAARSLSMLAVALAVLALWSVLMRRHVLCGEYHLNAAQSLLILVPMVPYLYIRSGLYMMAFNGWVAAPYQGEIVLILLSYAPTVVVMACAKNTLNGEIYQKEMLAMKQMLTRQNQQYLVKRDTIELVNKKYHDMKHFASVMAAGGLDPREGAALERDLAPFRLFVDTGNALVDVVLAEKIALCEERGIQLVPFADARDLDFVGQLDLCTLFGNALDNAIEATARVPDPDARTINVRVQTRGSLAVLVVSNPYVPGTCPLEGGGEPRAADGHGYGMGNMRHVAECYGGDLAYEAADGLFTLTVLLPLPSAASTGA